MKVTLPDNAPPTVEEWLEYLEQLRLDIYIFLNGGEKLV